MVLTESAGLVIMFTVPLFLQGSAFSWEKLPPKPVYGILGENVTLEWSFTLTYLERLDDFTLYRDGRQRMVKYDENGLVFYGTFKESVGLVGNGTPSFILINLKKTDDGVTYCCDVNTKLAPSGSQGNNYKKCTLLEIVVRPNITSISSNRTVNETSDVTLSCSANGTPHPNITWSKAGEANKTLGTGSLLSLKNISREQDGFYQCLADNGVGKTVASMRIVVQFAPSISIVGGSYNITEGRDLVLRCSSDGRPVPIVTWSKMKFSNIRFPPGHQLKIRNISRTEAGVYICTAANGIGQNVNAKMDVNVLYPPSIVEGNHVITLNESENLRLVCHATGHPQPMIQWSKSPNPGLMESIDGVLAVKNVTKSDSGTYECRASNGIGNDKVLSTLTVNYKPQGIVLRTNTTENAAIEGSSVTFVCSADSVPPSVYELRFKASSMGDSNNGIFTIQQVQASHQGTYECAARNILGIGAVATLHLDVLRPPSIDFISHNATANETNDVILFCNATGNPPPNITWTSLNDPDRRVLTTGDTLTLSNVTRDQSGTYQCVASNGLISAKTANVYVQINYKPEFIDEASANVVSWLNHETQIGCVAKGVPAPEIKWDRNGTVMSFRQSAELISNLTFTPKEKKDFGSYTCTARNPLGSTKRKVTVVMLAQPEAPQSLRIEPEFDNLEIHWSPSSVPSPTGPVLDYLAQVREKDEAEGWINCTQQRNQSLLMCVIKNLKSSTVYIVRVAGRNVVGYSEFIEQEVRTKATDKDDEHDEHDEHDGNNKDDEHDEHDADDGGKTTVEDRPKEIGELERHQGQSGYTVDAIIGGVISFSSLVVMIVAIVTQRRKCLVEKAKYNVNSRRNVEANGHDNNAFAENPRNDETEEEV